MKFQEYLSLFYLTYHPFVVSYNQETLAKIGLAANNAFNEKWAWWQYFRNIISIASSPPLLTLNTYV